MAKNGNPHKTLQFFLGLGLGLIPLIIFLASAFNSFLGPLTIGSIVLYIAELFAMVILISINKTRFVGYGVLTAFIVSPIIGAIGCNIIFSKPIL